MEASRNGEALTVNVTITNGRDRPYDLTNYTLQITVWECAGLLGTSECGMGSGPLLPGDSITRSVWSGDPKYDNNPDWQKELVLMVVLIKSELGAGHSTEDWQVLVLDPADLEEM